MKSKVIWFMVVVGAIGALVAATIPFAIADSGAPGSDRREITEGERAEYIEARRSLVVPEATDTLPEGVVPEGLVGDELAVALGLRAEPLPARDGECVAFAHTHVNSGYCIDDIVEKLGWDIYSADAYDLGQRLAGSIPSPADRDRYVCVRALNDADPDGIRSEDPEIAALASACTEATIRAEEGNR